MFEAPSFRFRWYLWIGQITSKQTRRTVRNQTRGVLGPDKIEFWNILTEYITFRLLGKPAPSFVESRGPFMHVVSVFDGEIFCIEVGNDVTFHRFN